MGCGSEGVLSLLALVPGGQVATWQGNPAEPVVVHMTCCKAHVRPARRWLQARMRPGDEVDTYGTEFVMRHWGQITEQLEDMPLLRVAQVSA